MPSLDRLLSVATGTLILAGISLIVIGSTIDDSWKGTQLTSIGMHCLLLGILTTIVGIIAERRRKKARSRQIP